MLEVGIDAVVEGDDLLPHIEAFREQGLSGADVTAVLVANHGPFAWGVDADQAVERVKASGTGGRLRIGYAPTLAEGMQLLELFEAVDVPLVVSRSYA